MPSVDDVPSLTPNQILALVVLMSEARQVDNKELKELAGFALTGADNVKLEKKLGLVETDRTHRPFAHELTEQGWRVVRQLHTTAPPKQGGSASRTLLTLLGNIQRGLEQLQATHGVKVSTGEFFMRSGETTQAAEDDSAAAHVEDSSIEVRVRAAYTELAAHPGDWVGLADLRDRLTDLDRADVDEALLALLDQDGVRIIPVANTKALTARDRAAAIRIGGEDNHTLSIGRP